MNELIIGILILLYFIDAILLCHYEIYHSIKADWVGLPPNYVNCRNTSHAKHDTNEISHDNNKFVSKLLVILSTDESTHSV